MCEGDFEMLNLCVDRINPIIRAIGPRSSKRETLMPGGMMRAKTVPKKRTVPKVFVDASRGTRIDLFA